MELATHALFKDRSKYPQTRFLFMAKNALALNDLVMLYLLFYLTVFITGLLYSSNEGISTQLTGTLTLIIQIGFLWIFSARVFNLYSNASISYIENTYRATWRTMALYILLFTLFFSLDGQNQSTKATLLIFFSLYGINLIISRFILTLVQTHFPKYFNIQKSIAIIGSSQTSERLKSYFKNNSANYTLAALSFEEDNLTDEHGISLVKLEKKFQDFVAEDIQEIYICLKLDYLARSRDIVNIAEKYCLRINFVPNIDHLSTVSYQTQYLGNIPILSVDNLGLYEMRSRVKKRFFDITFSLFIIIFILSWAVPLIAILIRLESAGPIFFKQKRSGRNNKPFYCYKFRSMYINAESDTQQARKGDARITPIGRFIRKTSIDELPQFFNVLMGEMSIVGPRPHMLAHTEYYGAFIKRYMARHYAKPGITGWAQVHGYRGDTKDPLLMQKRVEYDMWYLQKWTAMLDLRIVFLTIISVVKNKENVF